MAVLEIVSGVAPRRIELSARPVVLGRESFNDVVVAEPAVSRRHCRLAPTPAGWLLVDLGSANGIFVNGARITRLVLLDQDVLKVGETTMIFTDPAARGRAARPAPPAASDVVLEALPDLPPPADGTGTGALDADDLLEDLR